MVAFAFLRVRRQGRLSCRHRCGGARGDHPPEKRKVDSSILSLTTSLMRLEQPSYLH
jgi:hypothetical protein